MCLSNGVIFDARVASLILSVNNYCTLDAVLKDFISKQKGRLNEPVHVQYLQPCNSELVALFMRTLCLFDFLRHCVASCEASCNMASWYKVTYTHWCGQCQTQASSTRSQVLSKTKIFSPPFKVARNSFLARAALLLIARARASTPSSRRCKFDDLVPSKILQNLYFDRKYL